MGDPNLKASILNTELQKKMNGLENDFCRLSQSERHQRLEEISRFILEHRNSLDLIQFEKKWDHHVKQLKAKTAGFWNLFQNSTKNEDLRERVHYFEYLKDTATRARGILEKNGKIETGHEFESIQEYFCFTEGDSQSEFNSERDCACFLQSDEIKTYFSLLENLFQEPDNKIYLQMIHFIVTHKSKLDPDLLAAFAYRLNNRIQKLECFMKHKHEILNLYESHISAHPHLGDYMASSKFKAKIIYLRDLHDLILHFK